MSQALAAYAPCHALLPGRRRLVKIQGKIDASLVVLQGWHESVDSIGVITL